MTVFKTHGEYLEQKNKEKDMSFEERMGLEKVDEDPGIMELYKNPAGKYYLKVLYVEPKCWVEFTKEAQPYLKDTTEDKIFDTIAMLYEMYENHLTKIQDHFIKVTEEKDV